MTGVGVIGTGFMGTAHTEALRRLGADVVGIVGSTPRRKAGQGSHGTAAAGRRERGRLLADPLRRGRSRHQPQPPPRRTRPRRRSPPASTSCARSRSACRRPSPPTCCTPRPPGSSTPSASTSATTPRTRTPPRSSRPGDRAPFVTGRYHQDWLLLETDWNWRLGATRQGGLRAVADIGSHARPRPLPDRPPRRRGAGRPTARSSPSTTTRSARSRRSAPPRPTPSESASTWRATTRPACCCTSRRASAAARSARCRRGAEHYRVAGRRVVGRPRVGVGGIRSGCGSVIARPNEPVEKDRSWCPPAPPPPAAPSVEGYPDTFRALFAEVYRHRRWRPS